MNLKGDCGPLTVDCGTFIAANENLGDGNETSDGANGT
jgi:hypothetical protein